LTLAGQVTNDSAVPLEKATLIMLDIAFPLGTIAGGQNVPFSFHVNAPLHAVPIGGGSEQAATGQVTAPANPGKSTATSTLDLLRSTIPSEVAVSGADVINLTDRRVQARRVDLLNAFIRPDELGGGRGLQVYLVGWQASASFPAALNTPDSRAESDTLNIVALAMQFNTRVPVIALTPGYFTWQPIAADTTSIIPGAANNSNASALVTDDPYNLYVPSNGKTAFEFAPRSGVHVTQITNLTLLGQVVQTDAGALSLWDWANNRWVLVVQPGTQLSAPQGYATNDPADLARFVGNGGRVRVLIESVNGIADYSRLDITLGAELAMPISAS